MTQPSPDFDVWILGATGRIGRAVATRLARCGVRMTLVGRGLEELRQMASTLPGGDSAATRIVVADNIERMVEAIARDRPSVVLNTLGKYTESAEPLARACLYGAHYIDLAVDLQAMQGLLALHREAVAAGSTMVTGAGFGVLATEAVVAKLCEGRPTPLDVRVDALASVATQAGRTGDAFAATALNVLTTGGRRFEGGRLVRSRLASMLLTHRTPDGQTVKSASVPIGELLAAQRASGAPNVVATSALAPTAPLVRALLPLVGLLMAMPPVARFAARQMASAPLKPAPRPREHSWGHAVVTWPDGSRREGWLQADDAMDYTANVVVAVLECLAAGTAKPGAYTPAAAFGPEIAVSASGRFFLDAP